VKHERPQLEAGGAVEGPWYDHPTALMRPPQDQPTNGQPEAGELAALIAILTRLADALDRQAERPRVAPMALRIEEVADVLGVSRRGIERERAAGRFPKPDAIVGRMPLWKPETIRAFLERGGRP
jgi:predicted DNA-binding transcriptional regulator AlpA